MTLEYVIVQICQREYSPGLFYTGCSRVKDMEKLAIVGYSERTLNNGETTWFPPIQRLVQIFVFFFLLTNFLFMANRFTNISKQGKTKNKNKVSIVEKRDEELKKKADLFDLKIQDLEQNDDGQ